MLFRRFQSEIGPRNDQSRHDHANSWGAFSVLHFLSCAKPGSVNQAKYEGVKNNLCEDVYYKIQIQKLEEEKPSEKLLKSFDYERGLLLKKLKKDSPILIVEDQLEDGWKHAYEALFCSAAGDAGIIFAENELEARERFESRVKLVLLDVRLTEDRANTNQLETDQDVDQFGGVKLARWFSEVGPAVPIIAATASNKSWTLNALLDRGINAYWVKQMPGHVAQADHAAENVVDFYRKLNSTLVWSHKTREWVDACYSIHQTVDMFDRVVGKRLLSKARSLHALLHRAPSPFSDELSAGLQFNLGFLVLYSFMNDLVSWVCRVEECRETGRITWYLDYKDQKEQLVVQRVEKRSDENRKKIYFKTVYDLTTLDSDETYRTGLPHFPDSEVAIELLRRMGLSEEAESFKKINKVRNGLPLIHGKPGGMGTTSEVVNRVTEVDISSLVKVLMALVTKHSEWKWTPD